jgi:hypothetical protein
VVVVANMEHLITSTPVLLMADACNPVTHLIEVGELLRVEVEEVAWGFVLVAVRWLLRLKG